MRKRVPPNFDEQALPATSDRPASAVVGASPHPPLTPAQAATVLGIERTTLYGWLGLARRGLLILRGRQFELSFRQTGAAGQGRILIDVTEVERLREFLRVRPQMIVERRPQRPTQSFPGIHVPLGRPS